jgi:organic radical activating enzyme
MLKVLTKNGLKSCDDQSIKTRTNFKGWHCKQTNYIIDAGWWEVGTSVCRTPYPVSIDDFTEPKEIICPNENCFCGTDIAMPKGKTEDHMLMVPIYSSVKGKLKPDEEILAVWGDGGVVVDYYTDRKCNFSCSYCDPRSHNYTGQLTSLERMKEAWLKVNPQRVNKINISGGESTLIPYFIDFVKWLKDKEPKAMIWTLTNGTRQVPYLRELNKYSLINFSIHPEFINDRYINKLERFCEEIKLPCKMKIMYLPKFEDLVNKVYDRFKNKFNKLYVKTVPLWDMNNEMNLMKYTPEQLDFIHATQ